LLEEYLQEHFFQKIKPAIFCNSNPFKNDCADLSLSPELFTAVFKESNIRIPSPVQKPISFFVDSNFDVYTKEAEVSMREDAEVDIRTTITNIFNFGADIQKFFNIENEKVYEIFGYLEDLESFLRDGEYYSYQFGGDYNNYVQAEYKNFIAMYNGDYGDAGELYVILDKNNDLFGTVDMC